MILMKREPNKKMAERTKKNTLDDYVTIIMNKANRDAMGCANSLLISSFMFSTGKRKKANTNTSF